MTFKTITFYKYVLLKKLDFLKEYFQETCLQLSLNGRILIGEEGINGNVSGKLESVELFKTKIKTLSSFSDLTFREQNTYEQAHHKLVVRIRKEIVAFGKKVDYTNAASPLSPEALEQAFQNKEDILLLDARNTYETAIGKFQNALTLPIKNFREFPEASKRLNNLKNKKLVLYCTGGIRCEKASAYLKQQEFENVYQLQGGILHYLNKFPNSHFEGSCFVFDDRLGTETTRPISNCFHCKKSSSTYLNCFNLDCDKLFICCSDCQSQFNKTCSQKCTQAPRRRKETEKEREVLGIVENYYPKAQVALIKTLKKINKNSSILIKGKTTQSFTQEIKQLKNYDGNEIETASEKELITIPVSLKVRKHDKILSL